MAEKPEPPTLAQLARAAAARIPDPLAVTEARFWHSLSGRPAYRFWDDYRKAITQRDA